MFNKGLVLLVASGLLIKGETTNSPPTFNHSDYAGNTSQAQTAAIKAIDVFTVDIVTKIDKAESKIISYIFEANEMRSKVLAKAQNDIDAIIKEQEAETPGDKTCKKLAIDTIMSLKAFAVLRIDDCLRGKVFVLDEYLATLKSTASTASKMVSSAAAAIAKCIADGRFVPTCIGETALEYWESAQGMVGGVASVLEKAAEMYENMTKDLFSCAEPRVELLRLTAVNMVAGCKDKA